jgi:hypothetical protein
MRMSHRSVLSLVACSVPFAIACGGSEASVSEDPITQGTGGAAGSGGTGGQSSAGASGGATAGNGGAPAAGGQGGDAGTAGSGGDAGTSGGGTAGAAGNGGAGGFAAKGVGEACTTSTECRPGLSCGTGNTCEPTGTTAPGSPCILSAECAAGNFCAPPGVCAPSGTGVEGDVCSTDLDCKDGLRCDVVGLGGVCEPEGTKDLGAACTGSKECFGGLLCLSSVCAQVPPGALPLGSFWQGASCGTETGPTTAFFRIPRGSGDGDFYRLPFPNDIRTKDGHPDLSGYPTPGAGVLGFDAMDRYARALEGETGWGSYATTYFRFNAVVDLDSFQNGNVVHYVDVTPGDPAFGGERGYFWVLAFNRGSYVCENWLGVRTPDGSPLEPGHTYAVYLTKDGLAEDKTTILTSPDFDAMLSDSVPTDTAVAAAYPKYAPLRDYLKSAAIDKSTILNAAVFSVGEVQAPMEKIAAAAEAEPAPVFSGWVRCGDAPSPCADVTGNRACPATLDPDFDELHALVELPIYQKGTAPYLNPEDGGGVDTSGAVAKVRSESVCMSMTVPKGTMPAAGWPVVLYAHGTGGSFRSHVNEGVAKALATANPGSGAVPMAVLGIDQVQHGPRRNGSTQSPDTLFFNFLNPAGARGNTYQGAADQLMLSRALAGLSLDATTSPTGAEIKIDPEAVLFWGHSQGASEGLLAVPYSKSIHGAVFSGAGASLLNGLLEKTKPVDVSSALAFVLQDFGFEDKPTLYAKHFNPALSIVQSYFDPVDPLNHAARLTANAPAGVTPHQVFVPFGQGDSYSPPSTQIILAVAASLDVVTPDASVTMPDDIGGKVPYSPVSGNVSVGPDTFTAAVRQYAPDTTYDGHFVAFKNASAKADVVKFLAQMASKQTPSVGPLGINASSSSRNAKSSPQYFRALGRKTMAWKAWSSPS